MAGLRRTVWGLADAIMAPPTIVAAPIPEAVVSSSRRDNPGMFNLLHQCCSCAMCYVSVLAGGRIDLDQVGVKI